MANAIRLALGAVVGDGDDVREEGKKEEASTLEVGVLSLSTMEGSRGGSWAMGRGWKVSADRGNIA